MNKDNKENKVINVAQEKFEFVQENDRIHDAKFETKPIGYLHDAWLRFKKNKASVTAAIIILLIVIFAFSAPLFSNHKISDGDLYYSNRLPYSKFLSNFGIFTGATTKKSNPQSYTFYAGIGIGAADTTGTGATYEQGLASPYSPIQKYLREVNEVEKSPSGVIVSETLYRYFKLNAYKEIGFIYAQLTQEAYEDILRYEKETNRQVIYPMVNKELARTDNYEYIGSGSGKVEANYWYLTDGKSRPVDWDGNRLDVTKDQLVGNYLYQKAVTYELETAASIPEDKWSVDANVLYYSYNEEFNYYTRLVKDGIEPPAYQPNKYYKVKNTNPTYEELTSIYGNGPFFVKSGNGYKEVTLNSVADYDITQNYYTIAKYKQLNDNARDVRILYYEYYQYKNGVIPEYIFGTDDQGYDIFIRLSSGIKLSLILAVCVSAINLTLGAIYGSIEGYYGGTIDLIMERISDILSGVPFIVVATLFNLHLVQTGKVSGIVALLFAFVLTGWIGPAYRVRTQFYRFKGQEYVLAARTLGAKDARLMFKHIFPNTLGTLITTSILSIPSVIFSESMLSYLGIIQLNSRTTTSLGTMLSVGQKYLREFPHIILPPCIVISLLMISFNLFGNGLRDAFNPSLRGVEE